MHEGPGRLSSIDLLPAEAQDDVTWALALLNERSRPQNDILFELNDRLAIKGIGPISKSAFNRRAVRIWSHKRRMEDGVAIYKEIAPTITAASADEGAMVIGELIKTLILELLDAAGGQIDPKGAGELSRAYLTTLRGQQLSTEMRVARKAAFEAGVNEAIDAVGKARGLTATVVDDIKAKILGVERKAA